MTLYDEELSALKYARRFLSDLLDSKKYPRVPKKVRREAYWRLRHYPWEHLIDECWKDHRK